MNTEIQNRLRAKAEERGSRPSSGKLSTNTGLNFIDGDTIHYDPGDGGEIEKWRLTGYDTAETPKYQGGGEWKAGNVQGEAQADLIRNFADANGYNQVDYVLDENGERKKDNYNRNIVDLLDAKGGRLSTAIQATGAADRTFFNNNKDINQIREDNLLSTYAGLNLTDAEKELQARSRGINAAVGNFKSEYNLPHTRGVAVDEAHYAAGKPTEEYREGLVQNRHDDNRSISNVDQSFWDLKTHGKSALYGLESGLSNFTDLKADVFTKVGNLLDIEWLQKAGELNKETALQWNADIKGSFQDLPELKFGEAQFIDKDGNWDIHGVEDLTRKVVQTGVQSLPYILTTVAASTVGLAAGPAGSVALGTAAPSLIYSGQVYEEQEEKDPTAALLSGISQAALERLGIHLVGKASVYAKGGLDKAAAIFAKSKNVSHAAAKQTVASSIVRTTSETLKSIGQNSFTQVAGRTVAGGLGEGATEAGQEILGLLGAKKEVFGAEGKNRILTSFIAGSALGGPISGAHATYNALTEDPSVRVDGSAFGTGIDLTDAQIELQDPKLLHVRSTDEIAAGFKEASGTAFSANDFKSLVGKRSAVENLVFAAKAPIRYANSAFYNALAPVYSQNKVIRDLGSLLGVGDTHAGLNYQTAPQVYKQEILGDERLVRENYTGKLGFDTESVREIESLSTNLNSTQKDVQNIIDGKKVEGSYTQAQNTFLQAVAKASQAATRLTGFKQNLLSPTIDTSKLQSAQQKNSLVAELVADKDLDLDQTTASQIVQELSEGRERPRTFKKPAERDKRDKYERQFTEVANTIRGTDKFGPWTVSNPFAAIQIRTGSIAKQLATDKFIGKDGEIVSAAITEATVMDPAEGGLTPEQAARTLQEIIDVVEANEGARKVESKLYNTFVDSGAMLVRMTALPLVVITSILDLGLVAMKDVPPQVWLGRLTKDSNAFINNANAEARTINKFFDAHVDKSKPLVKAMRAGFYADTSSSATRFDNSLNSRFLENMSNQFFKKVGLELWTNWNRGVRLGIAQDAFRYYAQAYVSNINATDAKSQKEFQRTGEIMRRYGVDPATLEAILEYDLETGKTVDGFDVQPEIFKADMDALSLQLKDAAIRYTNTAVITPTTTNRALMHSDPFFRLFTTFTGWSTALTSGGTLRHIINNVSHGTNTEKASTAAMIVSLLGLAYISLAAKAALVESLDGDDEDYDKWKTPFPGLHNDTDKLRRIVDATGVLSGGSLGRLGGIGAHVSDATIGTNLALYDFASPDSIWDWITSESPILSYYTDVGAAAGKAYNYGVASPQTQKAITDLLPAGAGLKGAADNAVQSATSFLFGGS